MIRGKIQTARPSPLSWEGTKGTLHIAATRAVVTNGTRLQRRATESHSLSSEQFHLQSCENKVGGQPGWILVRALFWVVEDKLVAVSSISREGTGVLWGPF